MRTALQLPFHATLLFVPQEAVNAKSRTAGCRSASKGTVNFRFHTFLSVLYNSGLILITYVFVLCFQNTS